MTDVLTSDTSSCTFYVSSSTTSVSSSGEPLTLIISSEPDTFTFAVIGSGDYESYLYVGDTSIASPTPEIGYLLAQTSGSNTGSSATLYLSASHNYNVYLTIIGTNAP
jgi:hypothetical protein